MIVSPNGTHSRNRAEHHTDDQTDDIAGLRRWAQQRIAHQADPAIMAAWSQDELELERGLAQRIRSNERQQRWKRVEAASDAENRAQRAERALDKANTSDLLTARKALAVQRRMTSAHARLASLHRHRTWSLFTLGGVVVAGMLWSATNVQHNIAPAGTANPLYWFSYLVELMISACLAVIMVGTNKVADYGITDDRRMVVTAELALLALTIALNTYPYWHEGPTIAGVGVHAVPPVMIGVALMIHHAASVRYGQAITIQANRLPDDNLATATARTADDAFNPHAANAIRVRSHHHLGSTHTPQSHAHSVDKDASIFTDPAHNWSAQHAHTGHEHGPIRQHPHRVTSRVQTHPRLRLTNSPARRAVRASDASARSLFHPASIPDASSPNGHRPRALAEATAGRRTIDREQIFRIAQQHPSWSNKRIADKYGCSASAVDKIFRRTPRPWTPHHIANDEIVTPP